MTGSIFPELVVGRDDGFPRESWSVERGTTSRGDAYCNLTQRTLRVPFDDSQVARVIRAHELMHIRVSPIVEAAALPLDVSRRAIECAEEYRVNALLTRLHFDVALLSDGSEKLGGQQLGERRDWPEAVCFLLAVAGTGSEAPFLAGVRRSAPEWLAALRALRQRVRQIDASFETTRLAATTVDESNLPRGFSEFTIAIARLVTIASGARVPVGAEELRRFRRALEPGGRRPPTGRFAVLHVDESLLTGRRVAGSAVRRRVPATTGTDMRYPGRLLTDDLRRAFATNRRVPGGVIVIDQSGSMDVAESDIDALLRTAPRALIIGYSHRPGCETTEANAWLLARGGHVARHCPPGHVGNGVDGPILEWAIRHRESGPIVWVTDGQVTDSNDHPDQDLTRQCAQLVLQHRIQMVAHLSDVASAVRRGRSIATQTWSSYGRVGREVQRMKEYSLP